MQIVVDTSVIIAVIADESVKQRLVTLTERAAICAPPPIDWEVGNAFSAMLKRGRITLEQALQALSTYQLISIEIIEIDLSEAIKLADKYKIYAYDAYMI